MDRLPKMLVPVVMVAMLVMRASANDVPPAAVAARAAVVETPEAPVRTVFDADGRLFLDFGKAAFGWLQIEFGEPLQPTALVVRLGEKAVECHAVDTAPGASIVYHEIAVAVPADATSASAVPSWAPTHANWIGHDVGQREVAPFRYAEITGLPRGIDEPRVVRVTRHVPFDDEAAAFECSDPALVEVWNLCRHSIKATSFLGIYVDGNRERVAYEADALINQLCHYGVDDHYQTGRATLEHLLAHPTWPIEWRQQVPMIALADWLYSGDDEALRRHYDAIRASVMLDRRRPDGLFRGEAKGVPRDIIDWPKGERDGYDMTCDVKTVTTAFHAKSLEAMATIAKAIGRDTDAAEFQSMRDATAGSMRAKLFDEERGRFVDGLHADTDQPSRHASLHANMFPLAFGLVPQADVGRVARFVTGRGMACSVYGSQYLLDGLFDAGRDREALALMTATGDRGWLHMCREVGSTITLEAWDEAYKPNLDWNHAWGAVPANMIPRKLMGIEPLEPGFARVRVRPRIGGLEWATIRHPTPRGPIELAVRCRRDSWEADLTVPEGVVAELHVPVADPNRVSVHRADRMKTAAPRRAAGGGCLVEVKAGATHAVTIRRALTQAAPPSGGGS